MAGETQAKRRAGRCSLYARGRQRVAMIVVVCVLRIVGDDGAPARELAAHRLALLFEIEVAMTVVSAFAIDVVVDDAAERFGRQRFQRNVDDRPSSHVMATATTVLARCISVPYRL